MKSSELVQVGYDFCSTLIAMINSKILKRKFTVDTSLNHLYQMNQKAFKKQLSMISSKDDQATASLLGFAIANRVEPHSSIATGGNHSRLQDKDADESKSHQKREDRESKGQSTSDNKESGKAARKSKALARQEQANSQSKHAASASASNALNTSTKD